MRVAVAARTVVKTLVNIVMVFVDVVLCEECGRL
jgi:hypothetical protein